MASGVTSLVQEYGIVFYRRQHANTESCNQSFVTFTCTLMQFNSPTSRHTWLYSLTPQNISILLKVKWSHYRPGEAQRVGRGKALLFHDHGTRRGWVVSSTHWPHFTPGKDLVPILQEVGWAPGSVWMGRKSRPHWDSIPDCPGCSQLLYRLSYLAHISILLLWAICFDENGNVTVT